MEKYPSKIITQPTIKIYEALSEICSLLLYGGRPTTCDIAHEFAKRGVYYRTGFDTNQTSTTALCSYHIRAVRTAIQQIKFRNNRRLARECGEILSDYLLEELSYRYHLEHFADPLLLIVPVSGTTLRTRGYNQNHLIATHALKHGLSNYVEYAPRLITKPHHTTPQSLTRNKHMRMRNPRGAFVVTHTDKINGRNVILLDDVCTTGSTLNEVTRILKQAGAQKVMRITIAH